MGAISSLVDKSLCNHPEQQGRTSPGTSELRVELDLEFKAWNQLDKESLVRGTTPVSR